MKPTPRNSVRPAARRFGAARRRAARAAVVLAAALAGTAALASIPEGARTPVLHSPAAGASESESTILLAWSRVPGAREYVVLVSRSAFSGSDAAALLSDPSVERAVTAGTSIRLQDVLRGDEGKTDYSWAVGARVGNGEDLVFSKVSTFSAVKTFAGDAPATPLIREVRRGTSAVEPYGDGASILLASGLRFDPVREGEPNPPSTLTAAPLREGETGAYLVQIDGPVRTGQREEIAAAGGAIFAYVPNSAFVVRMTEEAKGAVQALPFVRWVGAYHPAYKLSPQREMSEGSGERRLFVLLFPDADLAAARAGLGSLGATVLEATDSGRNKLLTLSIDMSRAPEIAGRSDVAWIEPWHELTLFNSNAQWVVQTNVSQDRKIWDKGIRGEGQVVHTSDSGIRTTHHQFRDDAVPITDYGDFPTHRKIIAYKQSLPGIPFGDHPLASYHGTHTAGTFVGDDSPFAVDARDGMALKAKIYFTDAGRDANAIYAPGDLNLLFDPPYQGNAGGAARVSSNSWGGAVMGAYTIHAMTVDQFVWDHQDFLVSFSNGNSGTPASVGSPASFKNGVSSGATQNGAQSSAMMPLTSQGPAADGRLKPTVLSPGMSISSANGANDTGYQSLTGTSMSSPSGAGAIALMRQYLMEGWYPTGVKKPANGFTPSAALLKAMAISSTNDDMVGGPIPNNIVGWGRMKTDNILYFAGDSIRTALIDEPVGLATGEFVEYEIRLTKAMPLRIALCWTDKEGNPAGGRQLVNDLDLIVTDSRDITYLGNVFGAGQSITGGLRDSINVEECVRQTVPQNGFWTVRVEARNAPFSPQPFALAISGGISATAGLVRVDKTTYGRDDVVEIRVEDPDQSAGPAYVVVTSTTETLQEVVALPGANGVFTGTIATTALEPVNGDGKISVSHGDEILVSYEEGFESMDATATADFVGPVISGVSSVDEDVAQRVAWSTNSLSSSRVYYGLTPSLGQASDLDPTLVASHAVVLEGLLPQTTYYFDVESADRVGNVTRDDAGGNHYQFTTGKKGEILVVIGDGSFSADGLYATALANRGWDASFLKGGTIAQPNVGDPSTGMRSYAAVWWQVGHEQYPPFEDAARDSITKYLDGGARLAVTTHDAAWAFTDPASGFSTPARAAWLESALHIRFLEDPATWPAITGIEGDPISGAYTTGLLYNPHRAGAAGDEVEIVDGTGTGSYVWRNTDATANNIAIRWENGAPNGSPADALWGGTPTKLVTNCLEWSQISDAAAREDILDKTLIWLIGRDHPDAAVASPNGGEEITDDDASIAWTETAFGGESIATRALLYSSDGGSSWNLITGSAGAPPYTWDVSGLPNGEEYRVRVVVTDTGAPPLGGEDVSDANFRLNRPGGDTRGPAVVAGSIESDPNPMNNEADATLTATVSDVGFGGSVVAAAEWSRGGSPAQPGEGFPMSGSFDAATVDVSATVPALTVPTGEQTFWVRGRDAAGTWGNANSVTVVVNGNDAVSVAFVGLPTRFALEQNWPNPFNPMTTIRYALPRRSLVHLSIYNTSGERVRVLRDGVEEAGHRTATWDGRNEFGQDVASGVYLYRLEANEYSESQKMVLLR